MKLTANQLGLNIHDSDLVRLSEFLDGRDITKTELYTFAQVILDNSAIQLLDTKWKIEGESKGSTLFELIQSSSIEPPPPLKRTYTQIITDSDPLTSINYSPDPESHEYQTVKDELKIILNTESFTYPILVAPFRGASVRTGSEIRSEGSVNNGSRQKAGIVGFTVADLRIPKLAQPWEAEGNVPSNTASALEVILKAPLGTASYNTEFGRPCIGGFLQTVSTYEYQQPVIIGGGISASKISNKQQDRGLVPGSLLVVLGGSSTLTRTGISSPGQIQTSTLLDYTMTQRGNPEFQRRIQMVLDSFSDLPSSSRIRAIAAVKVGGLASAVPKLLKKFGVGADIDLIKIPSADKSMSPTEIWCCEAQERYILCIDPKSLTKFAKICERECAEYAEIGLITEDKRLVVHGYENGKNVIDLPLDIFNKPKDEKALVIVSKPVNLEQLNLPQDYSHESISKALNLVLQLPSVGCKSFLITISDRSVTGLVVRDQMVGPWQVPVSDVAVTQNSYGVQHGEAISIGEKKNLSLIDPVASVKMALAEAILNLCSADITKIQISTNWTFSKINFRDAYAVAEAFTEMCKKLGVVVSVGEDAMSMSGNITNIKTANPPDVTVSAVSQVKNIHKTWSPQIKKVQGSRLVLVDLALGNKRLGGSAYARVLGQLGNKCPDVENIELLHKFIRIVQKLHQSSMVLSYHDRSEGGLITTLLEMAFAGRTGLDITISRKHQDIGAVLFNEELGAVFQVANAQEFADFLYSEGIPRDSIEVVGEIELRDMRINIYYGDDFVYSSTRAELQQIWSTTSYTLQRLRDNPHTADQEFRSIFDDSDPGLSYKLTFDPSEDIVGLKKFDKIPKVAIIREKGTTGYAEMAWAFEQSGFTPVDVHMTDLVSGKTSLADFVGMALCSGSTYGDALGAGTGWANSVMCNMVLRKQFKEFINGRNDTFVLGVGNGCQFLSKIRSLVAGSSHWPMFGKNVSEKYESRLVMVDVVDSGSIFFNGMRGCRIPVPCSHFEGRASYPDFPEVGELAVLRYVDNYGKTTEKYPWNPNGSVNGIAGMKSQNGRVLGLMVNPERVVESWFPGIYGVVEPEYCVGNLNKNDQTYILESPWKRMFRNLRCWVG